MLDIVDHEQHLFAREMSDYLVLELLIPAEGDADGIRDGLGHVLGVAERG
jgi:hypothetical protein